MTARKPRRPRRATDIDDVTARSRGTVLLEVLAGVRTPSEAAEILGVTLPRYYHLEEAGIAGLVAALEPKAPGRPEADPAKLKEAEGRIRELQREVARLQALLRTAQKAIGLKAIESHEQKRKSAEKAGKRAPRRASVRARKAAERLRASLPEEPDEPPEATDPDSTADAAGDAARVPPPATPPAG